MEFIENPLKLPFLIDFASEINIFEAVLSSLDALARINRFSFEMFVKVTQTLPRPEMLSWRDKKTLNQLLGGGGSLKRSDVVLHTFGLLAPGDISLGFL